MASPPHPTSLTSLFAEAWKGRELVTSLARRELQQRYRGSLLGMAWTLVNPLLMLAIYTFVFASVFRMRWPQVSDNPLDFALMLFAGLLVFNVFAECMGRAAGLVLSTPNLVKKVVFPLHLQAWSVLGAALCQGAINLAVLLLAMLAVRGTIPWTAVLLPAVAIPLCLVLLGALWLVSALGVYLRDIGQLIGHLVMMLMFLSPLFYPVEAIPEAFRDLFFLNPMTALITEARKVLVIGTLPDWSTLGIYTLCALGFAWAGYAFFQRARRGFADVL
jgi:lipopolysaccharide transport system permease protein